MPLCPISIIWEPSWSPLYWATSSKITCHLCCGSRNLCFQIRFGRSVTLEGCVSLHNDNGKPFEIGNSRRIQGELRAPVTFPCKSVTPLRSEDQRADQFRPDPLSRRERRRRQWSESYRQPGDAAQRRRGQKSAFLP